MVESPNRDRTLAQELRRLADRIERENMTTFAPERSKVTVPPKGTRIGLREASRKYGIRAATISGWRDLGWVERVGDGLDEHDIATVINDHPGKSGPKPIPKIA